MGPIKKRFYCKIDGTVVASSTVDFGRLLFQGPPPSGKQLPPNYLATGQSNRLLGRMT